MAHSVPSHLRQKFRLWIPVILVIHQRMICYQITSARLGNLASWGELVASKPLFAMKPPWNSDEMLWNHRSTAAKSDVCPSFFFLENFPQVFSGALLQRHGLGSVASRLGAPGWLLHEAHHPAHPGGRHWKMGIFSGENGAFHWENIGKSWEKIGNPLEMEGLNGFNMGLIWVLAIYKLAIDGKGHP